MYRKDLAIKRIFEMREIEIVFAILEVFFTEAFSYNWARSVKQLKYTYTSQMDLNTSRLL